MTLRNDLLTISFAYAEAYLAIGNPMTFGALLFQAGSAESVYVPLKGSFVDPSSDLPAAFDYLSEMALQAGADAVCVLARASVAQLPTSQAAGLAAAPATQEALVAALHLCDGKPEVSDVRLIVQRDRPVLVDAPKGLHAPGMLAANVFSHESPHRREEVAHDLAKIRAKDGCPDWARASASRLN